MFLGKAPAPYQILERSRRYPSSSTSLCWMKTVRPTTSSRYSTRTAVSESSTQGSSLCHFVHRNSRAQKLTRKGLFRYRLSRIHHYCACSGLRTFRGLRGSSRDSHTTVFFEPAAGEGPAFSSHLYSDEGPPIRKVRSASLLFMASLRTWILRWN
jgi:hypothetical protein